MRMPNRLALSVLILSMVVAPGCGSKKVAKSKDQPRETLHKTTQNVLKLQDAFDQGGVLADTTIPVADPLTQNAAAYRTTVGKIGAMAVEQAIQMRNAQNIMEDPKPLPYDVFMDEIIRKDKPDGIQLAMLPYYQEYAWDEVSQKLVVVEFPEKKANYQKQKDAEYGR